MELTETIELINKQLTEHYGIDTITSQPMWRVSFSEDQFEKRYGTYDDITAAGIFIRQVTEVRLVPKYSQWIHAKYVLERLVAVPVINMPELPATTTSYEPIWVFEDRHGNYLPPKFEAAKVIVDTVHAAQYGDHSLARYKDPEDSQEASIELKKQRIDTLVNELFGDETGLLGTTISGQSIIVPRNYEKRGN